MWKLGLDKLLIQPKATRTKDPSRCYTVGEDAAMTAGSVNQ
jgi:hypothetical protein